MQPAVIRNLDLAGAHVVVIGFLNLHSGTHAREVIGADGVHVGKVDRVEGKRIKLTRHDSGAGRHKGHHHFVPLSLVAEIEGGKVRLTANADVAVTFEEEEGGAVTQ